MSDYQSNKLAIACRAISRVCLLRDSLEVARKAGKITRDEKFILAQLQVIIGDYNTAVEEGLSDEEKYLRRANPGMFT